MCTSLQYFTHWSHGWDLNLFSFCIKVILPHYFYVHVLNLYILVPYIQNPDNSNLQGKEKKVQVIGRSTGSWEQMTWQKDKWWCCAIHAMYILIAIWLVPRAGRISLSEIIKNVSSLSGHLLNDLYYYVYKNLSVKPFFNLDHLCFHYYLLVRNCSVCHKSWHDYSPKMFGSFARLLLCCRKK